MILNSSFYQLSYTQQADAILRDGTFLQTRKENNLIVDLYELDNLLVELFYLKESEELVSLLVYNTSETLPDFVNGINLAPRLTFKNNMVSFANKKVCA